MHTEGMPCGKKDRDWGDVTRSQETPKTASKLPEARRYYGTGSLSQPSEGSNPANILILELGLYNHETINFCCLRYFVMATLANSCKRSLGLINPQREGVTSRVLVSVTILNRYVI